MGRNNDRETEDYLEDESEEELDSEEPSSINDKYIDDNDDYDFTDDSEDLRDLGIDIDL